MFGVHPRANRPASLPLSLTMTLEMGSASEVKAAPANYSIAHAVPGYGKPLDYIPDETVRPQPSSLSSLEEESRYEQRCVSLPSYWVSLETQRDAHGLPLTTLREFRIL